MSASVRIVLRDIGRCSTEQQDRVLQIRNEPGVRKAMYTDHVISAAEHQQWLTGLASDQRQQVFVVLKDEEPAPTVAGVASVSAIDARHKKTDWAFYLDASQRGGLGAALEFAMIHHVFDTLGFEKLNCEVLASNPAVVRMHEKFGFEREGLRRENILRDGQRIDVHFLGLIRADWESRRGSVQTAIAQQLARFEVHIEPQRA